MHENPFPYSPSLVPRSENPRLNGTIYNEQLHEGKAKDFERLLIPGPGRNNPQAIAFLMDFASRRGRGIGKTAFLNHQREEIMKDLGDRASGGTSVMFAAHVIATTSPPCRKFWEFCRTIAETLCEQNIIAQAVWRLRALSGKIPDSTLQQTGNAEEWSNTIGNDGWLANNGVNVLFDLNPSVERKLKDAGVREDLAHDLAEVGATPSLQVRLLERFTDYRWRRDGGRLVFHDLVNCFKAAEFSRGLLLIDEVEKIVYHQNVQERRAFVESLRYYVMDGNCANARYRFFGILLTIHPSIQEILLSHWKDAGLDRLAPLTEPDTQQSTIYFEPLNNSMAIPLITEYLDYFRIAPAQRGTIQPFSEDAVVEALVKSGGVPGPMLQLLHRVIERAIEIGKASINKSFVEVVHAELPREEASEIDNVEHLPSVQVKLTD
ncbi:hypothetical protein L0244_02475 [bacterium]|nr:hypothetical protein [bacterium]